MYKAIYPTVGTLTDVVSAIDQVNKQKLVLTYILIKNQVVSLFCSPMNNILLD